MSIVLESSTLYFHKVGETVKALGHEVGATQHWVGLRMTSKRQAALLEKLRHVNCYGL